uniref:Splicing factor 1 n=1 Tax=Trichuris muris TaxID=70415 RepID=A0A5S6R3I7_TRIMR
MDILVACYGNDASDGVQDSPTNNTSRSEDVDTADPSSKPADDERAKSRSLSSHGEKRKHRSRSRKQKRKHSDRESRSSKKREHRHSRSRSRSHKRHRASRSKSRDRSRETRRRRSRSRSRRRSKSKSRKRSSGRDRYRYSPSSRYSSRRRSSSHSRSRNNTFERERSEGLAASGAEDISNNAPSPKSRFEENGAEPEKANNVNNNNIDHNLPPESADTSVNESLNSSVVDNESSAEAARRRRKSRWSKEGEKAFVPGMPTALPMNLTEEQQKLYLLQLQIEDITRKLRTGDLGIPANPEERSPSPEPIYDSFGKRLNTREVRTRQNLENERHRLIIKMQEMNPLYKPPSDYKPPLNRLSEKVYIPQDEHPELNFVGLLIGPRGNTLKQLERDTNTRIIIRGKGSVKEGKIGKREGPMPGEDEPLHAYITASEAESLQSAVERITNIIQQALEVPESQNELRKLQLRELALLNGTLRGDELALATYKCSNCGASTHKSWECPDRPNVTANIFCAFCGGAGHIARDCKNPQNSASAGAVLDEEYSALLAELGHDAGKGAGGLDALKPVVRINLAKPRLNVPSATAPFYAPQQLVPGMQWAPWMAPPASATGEATTLPAYPGVTTVAPDGSPFVLPPYPGIPAYAPDGTPVFVPPMYAPATDDTTAGIPLPYAPPPGETKVADPSAFSAVPSGEAQVPAGGAATPQNGVAPEGDYAAAYSYTQQQYAPLEGNQQQQSGTVVPGNVEGAVAAPPPPPPPPAAAAMQTMGAAPPYVAMPPPPQFVGMHPYFAGYNIPTPVPPPPPPPPPMQNEEQMPAPPPPPPPPPPPASGADYFAELLSAVPPPPPPPAAV